jgi:HD-like signal output (HDOD) protein
MAIFGRRKRAKPWEDVSGFDLPHFSATTLQTLEVLRSQENDATDAVKVLCQDPGLSVRVLRMVNSASFGARRAVENLGHAVQMVGRASLESLVISLAVKDALPSDPPGVDGHRFWRMAARRAAIARSLAQVLCPAEASAQFTAALLADMAIPLLALRMGGEYTELLGRAEAGAGELGTLELEAFGWHHAEVGAWMCEQWELPAGMARCIRAHHAGEPPRDPTALASLLERADPEEEVGRVAELAAEEWNQEAAALEALIFQALQNAEDATGL